MIMSTHLFEFVKEEALGDGKIEGLLAAVIANLLRELFVILRRRRRCHHHEGPGSLEKVLVLWILTISQVVVMLGFCVERTTKKYNLIASRFACH